MIRLVISNQRGGVAKTTTATTLARLWADAGPAFYIEHLKRLRKNGIQPYFMLAHVHQLEIVERLIRKGSRRKPR